MAKAFFTDPHTYTCTSCLRKTRLSRETLDQIRSGYDGMTDAEIVESMELCIPCAGGAVYTNEGRR